MKSGRILAIAAALAVLLVLVPFRRPPKATPSSRTASDGGTSITAPNPELPSTSSRAAGGVPRHERNPHLEGDPELIQRIIADLDRPGASAEDLAALHARLKSTLDDLLTANGIHVLPLLGRILCDPTLPPGLREAALEPVGRWSLPQTADFLARLTAGGKLAPDVQGACLGKLAGLMERLHDLHRTLPLKELCLQACEAALRSSDPALRRAAVETYVTLAQPPDPAAAVRTLFAILRSDPSPDVRGAAVAVLIQNKDFTLGNEWLSNEMGTLLTSPDASTRGNALRVLVATRTPAARRAVLAALEDPSTFVRSNAIFGAGALEVAEAVPAMTALLASDSERMAPWVLPALAKIPGFSSARAILVCATADPDIGVRMQALENLKDAPAIRDAQLAPELVELHRSRLDENERDSAAAILSRNASPQAYSALRTAYVAAVDDVRLSLASLLLQSPFGGDFVQSSFTELIVTTAGPEALKVLAAAAPDRALQEIQNRYANPRGDGLSEEAKRSAIEALLTLGSARAVDVLESILKIETDRDLKQLAERALKEIRDE